MTDQPSLHSCEGRLPEGGYGQAITSCSEDDDGKLWAGNDEYGSNVNFCPYCGYKAKVQVQAIKSDQ